MRISNKNVDLAISKLEEFEDEGFINEKEKAEEKIETTKEEILTEEVEFDEEMEI